MITLHAYFLRELLKTFALTVVALTGLFTMGGGLYNIMRYEGVTATDLVRVLPWLLPIVITLTMPLAALFATTITYGRFAADNEFTACRAAGINVQYLFLPALGLSLLIAALTVVSVNVVIPDFIKRIDRYARSNLRDLAYHRLLQSGYIRYDHEGAEQYILTAQSVQNVSNRALREAGFEPAGGGLDYFWVDTPTFLWIDRDSELVQFTLASGGLCQFDSREDDVRVTIYIKDAQMYEVGRASVQVRDQVIGPVVAPIPFPVKPSMVDLATLARWRDAPWDAPDIAERVERLRDALRVHLFQRYAVDRLAAAGPLELNDDHGRLCRIEAGEWRIEGGEVRLNDARVEVIDARIERPTRITAPEGRLLTRITAGRPMHAELSLLATVDRFVLEYDGRARESAAPRQRASEVIEPLALPDTVETAVAAYTAKAILEGRAPLPDDDALARSFERLGREVERLRRKVVATIHFRMGFASSALATVVMGALLGVMYRGSKALAAFGLACIPFGSVTLLMFMGRSLTESRAGEAIGPLTIWGGLLAVAVADVIILRLGIRR